MMPGSTEVSETPSDTSERHERSVSFWTSGLVSVAIHATVLLIAGASLRGCQNAPPASAGGLDYREIGLAMIPDQSAIAADDPTATPQDSTADTPSEQEATETHNKQDAQQSVPDLSDALPTEADLPTSAEAQPAPFPELVGTGVEAASALPAATTSLPDLMRPRAKPGAGAGGSLTPGPNATSFMNIVGEGDSFVYVIDVSSSMQTGERLNLAKSQLKGSLRLLTAQQKFQVLFYNEWTTLMKLRHPPDDNLYRASELTLLLAEREIDRVRPEGGTSHLKPLLEALSLQPDVVYFLTDGDQPRLTQTELRKVNLANRSNASIHVVEFGSGAKESRELSWLQLLAAKSGGKYSYIPVR